MSWTRLAFLSSLGLLSASLASAQPATTATQEQSSPPAAAAVETTGTAAAAAPTTASAAAPAAATAPISASADTMANAPGPMGGTAPTTGTAARLQPAPPPKRAEPGKVVPTAVGDRGGATSFTAFLPTDVESLIDLRRPFTSAPEFRGAWVTRFDWTGGRRSGGTTSPEELKSRIVEIMDSAEKLNLNAVLFQVRGDATTLYPSKLEPWSQLLGGKDPGFDPVRFAIDEAHKRGLEFHAYMNPGPLTEERSSAPASTNHIYFKHATPEARPNWLVFKDGRPAPFHEYLWLNLNLPEVQKHIRDVVMDFVTRYDVDGVHFDRIRLPGPDVSDDPWSKERFEGGANPHKKTYAEWQAENITRMLTDIYAAIMEVKPKIKVSAAVWGIYDNTQLPQGTDKASGYSWTSSGLQDFAQDSIAWINRGAMDALVPMIYWNMGDLKPDYDELVFDFMTKIHNGRHLYGGQRVFSNEEMVRQVLATNLIGAHGTVPFTLNRISNAGTAEFYRKNIYPTKVPVPEMPWKKNPVFGHVIATVTDLNGKPVRDAHVKVQGRGDVALSTLDGFTGLLDLVPGEVTVTAEKAGMGSATRTIQVQRGQVTRVELKLAR